MPRSAELHNRYISNAPMYGVKGPSHLLDLVSFPNDVLFDYMHQVCLGVMRTIFFTWLPILSPMQKDTITERLHSIVVPHEFKRKPRTISEAKQYKASEWKNLLLYYGPLVFNDILPIGLYKHFLLLSSAIYLLCEASLIDVSGELIKSFFLSLSNHYEDPIFTFNVHCLLHLADQVKSNGSLMLTSAFTFENAVGHLIRYCYRKSPSLSQIYTFFTRRISECHTSLEPKGIGEKFVVSHNSDFHKVCQSNNLKAIHLYKRGFINGKIVHTHNYSTAQRTTSAVVCLGETQNIFIGEIQNIIECDDHRIYLYVRLFQIVNSAIPKTVDGLPVNSHIFLCKNSNEFKFFNVKEVVLHKCALMPHTQQYFYCIKLLNSFEHD